LHEPMSAAASGPARDRKTSLSTCAKANASASRSLPETYGWPKSGSRCDAPTEVGEHQQSHEKWSEPVKTFRVVGVDGESPEAALLWDLGCLGLIEERTPNGPAVMAYFDNQLETGLSGTWDDILDVDDVAIYRASLEPVRVGRLIVAPSHAKVEAGDGDLILWLDPGSAFGTGHHETTRLALASLERSDLRGKTVID